jgi:hypothetical protein
VCIFLYFKNEMQPILIHIPTLCSYHERATIAWHEGNEVHAGDDGLHELVLQQHACNFNLWHEEDKARDPSASSEAIELIKRRIDTFNQKRNDLIESIDEALHGRLCELGIRPLPQAAWNSETPGSIIDRLSIIALKIYHLR